MTAQLGTEKSAPPNTPIEEPVTKSIRKKTDFPAFLLYLISSIVWVGAAFFGYSEKIRLQDSSFRKWQFRNYNDSNDSFHSQAALTVVGFCLLALLLSILYLKLVKNYAKILIRVALGAFFLTLLSLFSTTLYYDGEVRVDSGIFIIILTLVFVTALAVKYHKEMNYSTEIVAEAAKIVCLSQSNFWVAFIELPLTFAFFLLNEYNLSWMREVSRRPPPVYIYFLFPFNLFIFFWTICFINGVKYMTLSGSLSAWFSSSKNNEVPSKPIQRSLNTVGKYHLGTIAFGSFIKTICLIAVIFFMEYYERATLSATRNPPTLLLNYSLFLTIWICLMDFVMCFLRGVYAQTALFGTNFKTSTSKVIGLVKENFGKFTLTIQVSYLVFALGAIITVGIPVFLLHMTQWDDYVVKSLTSAFNIDSDRTITVLFPVMLTYSIFDTLNAAVETILMCNQICRCETSQNYKTLLLNESA